MQDPVFVLWHVVNCKSVKREPFSLDWFWGQNLKTFQAQVPWWNGKLGCNFLYLFIIFFLLKCWDFLWNHFVTQIMSWQIYFYQPISTSLTREIKTECPHWWQSKPFPHKHIFPTISLSWTRGLINSWTRGLI